MGSGSGRTPILVGAEGGLGPGVSSGFEGGLENVGDGPGGAARSRRQGTQWEERLGRLCDGPL